MRAIRPLAERAFAPVRLIFRAMAALAAAGLLHLPPAARADCEVAGGFQTYYVLGREDHLYGFFVAGRPGRGRRDAGRPERDGVGHHHDRHHRRPAD